MIMSTFEISPNPLTIKQIEQVLKQQLVLELSSQSRHRIENCYSYLHKKLKNSDLPIYGINTGFGSLCNTQINKEDLSQLQENLVKSHACGSGEEVDPEIVRLMLLLKIHALALGHSGVSPATVERLIFLYNEQAYPVVYQLGSLGASGDLAPLAHLSLALLGLGMLNYKGGKISCEAFYKERNIQPLRLEAKEGLALLNGTQFMSAHGVHLMIRMYKLSAIADCTGAVSLEGFFGLDTPFHPSLHKIRPHAGQAITATNFRHILSGSGLQKVKKNQVQDPYTFRCIPQVHGASKDQFRWIEQIVETEINSVTDNPTIFPEEDLILSGGNFHGQPIAIAFDLLCIAVAELGSISERRIYKLISGQRNLPAFLTPEPGLNSGLMIPQYTAASIASQNKQLCTPASVDSIDSSNGQEDHVSMGANAATKALRVVNNLERILSIELLNASQALSFRTEGKSSALIENWMNEFRVKVPIIREDILMHEHMEAALKFIQTEQPIKGVQSW